MPDPSSAIKRLVVCFDGTWNVPENDTNVSRLYAAVADVHGNCADQLKFYDAGVGTVSGTRMRGAAFGWGLDENILQGYCWLINEYGDGHARRPAEADGEAFDGGPDIFIFGFSRGAYTARSLAGLVNRCGLPRLDWFRGEKNPSTGRVDHRASIQSARVREAWNLYRTRLEGGRDHPDAIRFRGDRCRNVKIAVLGVWDTVGALGVPWFSKLALSRVRYGFHDTSLGRTVERAYHAIAIDEQREDYKVTLWDAKHPVGTLEVEQRWFPGAHANVGGGYEDDLLPDRPLSWLAEKARSVGLEFTDEFEMKLGRAACKASLPESFRLRGDEYLSPVRDSYAEFLRGVYRLARGLRLKGRYWRPMLVGGVGETIDETAHMKWAADPGYRPRNLALAGRQDH